MGAWAHGLRLVRFPATILEGVAGWTKVLQSW